MGNQAAKVHAQHLQRAAASYGFIRVELDESTKTDAWQLYYVFNLESEAHTIAMLDAQANAARANLQKQQQNLHASASVTEDHRGNHKVVEGFNPEKDTGDSNSGGLISLVPTGEEDGEESGPSKQSSSPPAAGMMDRSGLLHFPALGGESTTRGTEAASLAQNRSTSSVVFSTSCSASPAEAAAQWVNVPFPASARSHATAMFWVLNPDVIVDALQSQQKLKQRREGLNSSSSSNAAAALASRVADSIKEKKLAIQNVFRRGKKNVSSGGVGGGGSDDDSGGDDPDDRDWRKRIEEGIEGKNSSSNESRTSGGRQRGTPSKSVSTAAAAYNAVHGTLRALEWIRVNPHDSLLPVGQVVWMTTRDPSSNEGHGASASNQSQPESKLSRFLPFSKKRDGGTNAQEASGLELIGALLTRTCRRAQSVAPTLAELTSVEIICGLCDIALALQHLHTRGWLHMNVCWSSVYEMVPNHRWVLGDPHLMISKDMERREQEEMIDFLYSLQPLLPKDWQEGAPVQQPTSGSGNNNSSNTYTAPSTSGGGGDYGGSSAATHDRIGGLNRTSFTAPELRLPTTGSQLHWEQLPTGCVDVYGFGGLIKTLLPSGIRGALSRSSAAADLPSSPSVSLVRHQLGDKAAATEAALECEKEEKLSDVRNSAGLRDSCALSTRRVAEELLDFADACQAQDPLARPPIQRFFELTAVRCCNLRHVVDVLSHYREFSPSRQLAEFASLHYELYKIPYAALLSRVVPLILRLPLWTEPSAELFLRHVLTPLSSSVERVASQQQQQHTSLNSTAASKNALDTRGADTGMFGFSASSGGRLRKKTMSMKRAQRLKRADKLGGRGEGKEEEEENVDSFDSTLGRHETSREGEEVEEDLHGTEDSSSGPGMQLCIGTLSEKRVRQLLRAAHLQSIPTNDERSAEESRKHGDDQQSEKSHHHHDPSTSFKAKNDATHNPPSSSFSSPRTSHSTKLRRKYSLSAFSADPAGVDNTSITNTSQPLFESSANDSLRLSAVNAGMKEGEEWNDDDVKGHSDNNNMKDPADRKDESPPGYADAMKVWWPVLDASITSYITPEDHLLQREEHVRIPLLFRSHRSIVMARGNAEQRKNSAAAKDEDDDEDGGKGSSHAQPSVSELVKKAEEVPVYGILRVDDYVKAMVPFLSRLCTDIRSLPPFTLYLLLRHMDVIVPHLGTRVVESTLLPFAFKCLESDDRIVSLETFRALAVLMSFTDVLVGSKEGGGGMAGRGCELLLSTVNHVGWCAIRSSHADVRRAALIFLHWITHEMFVHHKESEKHQQASESTTRASGRSFRVHCRVVQALCANVILPAYPEEDALANAQRRQVAWTALTAAILLLPHFLFSELAFELAPAFLQLHQFMSDEALVGKRNTNASGRENNDYDDGEEEDEESAAAAAAAHNMDALNDLLRACGGGGADLKDADSSQKRQEAQTRRYTVRASVLADMSAFALQCTYQRMHTLAAQSTVTSGHGERRRKGEDGRREKDVCLPPDPIIGPLFFPFSTVSELSTMTDDYDDVAEVTKRAARSLLDDGSGVIPKSSVRPLPSDPKKRYHQALKQHSTRTKAQPVRDSYAWMLDAPARSDPASNRTTSRNATQMIPGMLRYVRMTVLLNDATRDSAHGTGDSNEESRESVNESNNNISSSSSDGNTMDRFFFSFNDVDHEWCTAPLLSGCNVSGQFVSRADVSPHPLLALLPSRRLPEQLSKFAAERNSRKTHQEQIHSAAPQPLATVAMEPPHQQQQQQQQQQLTRKEGKAAGKLPQRHHHTHTHHTHEKKVGRYVSPDDSFFTTTTSKVAGQVSGGTNSYLLDDLFASSQPPPSSSSSLQPQTTTPSHTTTIFGSTAGSSEAPMKDSWQKQQPLPSASPFPSSAFTFSPPAPAGGNVTSGGNKNAPVESIETRELTADDYDL